MLDESSLMIFKSKVIINYSKVIAAEGEHKASRALRHAAEVICDSPAALQVSLKLTRVLTDLIISVAIPADPVQHLC